jgi:hypothetical protein
MIELPKDLAELSDPRTFPATDRYSRARQQAAKQILGDKCTPTVELVIYNPTRKPWPPDSIEACGVLTDQIWDQINTLADALVKTGAVT